MRNGAESVPAFDPEKVKDIEIGAKTEFLDRRLRLNVALFQSWTSDVQRSESTVVNGASTNFLVNSGNVRIKGAEFEVTAIPWRGMEVNGSLSLLDGHYKEGTFTETQLINGVPTLVDRSGEPLTQLPKTQLGFTATQRIPLSFGVLSIRGDYAYVSSQTFGPVTVPPGVSAAQRILLEEANRLSRIPGYGTFNARVGLELRDNLELYAFGANLTDEKYRTRVFSETYATGVGIALEYVGNPRTYGVGANVRF